MTKNSHGPADDADERKTKPSTGAGLTCNAGYHYLVPKPGRFAATRVTVSPIAIVLSGFSRTDQVASKQKVVKFANMTWHSGSSIFFKLMLMIAAGSFILLFALSALTSS
jgi:hypothetical protein